MNIVKGVADLIRRSSTGQPGDGAQSGPPEKLLAPSPRIQFSDLGQEAVLNTLWQKYEHAVDKTEKKKALQVFILHFIQTYNNWEPSNYGQLTEREGNEDIITGCSFAHPSEITLILVQEIARITSLISDLGSNGSEAYSSSLDQSDQCTNLGLNTDGLYMLNCLMIITRSMHNCRVFSYYGGVQKVTALLKAAVIQLKALTSSLASEENSNSNSSTLISEKTRTVQTVLLYTVTIVSTFMDLEYSSQDKSVAYQSLRSFGTGDLNSPKGNRSDHMVRWQQKAVVLVMETGGVNWLVELLRVIRRLNMKNQWTDLSLHFITLKTLKTSLTQNVRAQNHFRSIGGLEILLDGLGVSSSRFSLSHNEQSEIFKLQILSLEVLRESIFGNTSNLQFLCENGRIHKFANSISWPAFTLQELSRQTQSQQSQTQQSQQGQSQPSQSQTHLPHLTEWNLYCTELSRALCSFLLPHEDIKFFNTDVSQSQCQSQSSQQVSLAYWELAVRWIIKVLLTVFPCIKACGNETDLPNHIRVLGNTMQHYILCSFRKVLVSSPALLKVFREEGVWDLIFSEKFFYFGPGIGFPDSEGKEGIGFPDSEGKEGIGFPDSEGKGKAGEGQTEMDGLQVEAVSFLEFAATHNGNTNNLPECSFLLQMLEQSSSNAIVSNALLKSMHRVLQLATEQTLISFKSLDSISRVLRVACGQAQKMRKLNPSEEELGFMSYMRCIESAFDLFEAYLTMAENGRVLVLHSMSCVDCLFELFWVENLRKHVLDQILELFRLPKSSTRDHAGKMHLCSKFLETFTRAKDKDNSFDLSIVLLSCMREIIMLDQQYYQGLFCRGECFLHVVSLLNGTVDETSGEQLVLNVLETLTLLLTGNDDSKTAFRTLVGPGYQTLQSLLMDFCKWLPSERLLSPLLDMLFDGKFEISDKTLIKNEDVIVLFLNVLHKSSNSTQHQGLDILQNLLKDSITNRTSCFKAGTLSFLLDWFSVEERDEIIMKIAQIIQMVGGHSISGKDIRKIFTLLRGEKVGSKQRHSSLLLSSVGHMLKEKGPEAFFEFSGFDSGIEIKTPVQWPYNKGFSFSCWLRVENFPERGIMGLFSFFTENGKGCLAMLAKGNLIFESINQKRQCVLLPLRLVVKQWHFVSITHSIGRAFSSGSQLRCYLDGNLISSEKCRYAKVSDLMTRCTVGAELMPISDEPNLLGFERAYPFIGQMGPVYAFSDTLSPEQIKGIYSLGPSYMYSFIGDQTLLSADESLFNGILNAKEGISSKIIFGLNAQASHNRTLFSVSQPLESSSERSKFEATVMDGTKLCSRRLLKEIIYCVGGVSVFFPLLTRFDKFITNKGKKTEDNKLAANVIELVASVLDGNLANQQQMHILSGFAILGFLLQSVPPHELNLETLQSLKYMFSVLKNCAMSETLTREALARIYLNPHIWLYSSYSVQRELFLFLIDYFESYNSLLPELCALPRVLDVIRQFYWEKPDSRWALGTKGVLLDPVSKEVLGERPSLEEVGKVRLLLLSLAEMSLRQKISAGDIKALISFFERSQDMACIEDVLHMIMRALSNNSFLTSFIDQVNSLGGCHIFVNLLQRDVEPIRLLGLQFLGKLLVGLSSEKKGAKFFALAAGRSKYLTESSKKGTVLVPNLIFSAISERIFKFPLSDNLCATLFDVLLGGASPKQVLQKRSDVAKNKNYAGPPFSSHFVLPQILVCIFKFLQCCNDSSVRSKILEDLLGLLVTSSSNIEALMEHGWSSWLETSVLLDVFKHYKPIRNLTEGRMELTELMLVRNLYSVVLTHYLYSVKGGWSQLEETINFLVLKTDQGKLSDLLKDIFEDLAGSLIEISPDENIFMSQPCRDNTLYFLKLVHDLLVSESGIELMLSTDGAQQAGETAKKESQSDISSSVRDIFNAESGDQLPRLSWNLSSLSSSCWSLYDKTWTLICAVNGKGPGKSPTTRSPVGPTPSFTQRARGLVESLNIPAAEVAAVVVAGGQTITNIGTALGGGRPSNKYVDKAMLLRGERCPRVIFHLVVMYLCKADLESASRCTQLFISLLPTILGSDDEMTKSRLHYFIWSLLTIRSQYGGLDDGARYHVISHLLLEMVICGKSMLANSILGREENADSASNNSGNNKEANFILSLLQKDRVLYAALDEARYMKAAKSDRLKQMEELSSKLKENLLEVQNQLNGFEEEIQSNKTTILTADDARRAAFQLAFEEDKQIVKDKWVHIYRALIDERGPWSASPFPNPVPTHWRLDSSESSSRRRLKLKRNYNFNPLLTLPPSPKPPSHPDQSAKPPCQPDQSAKEADQSANGQDEGAGEQERMRRVVVKEVRGIMEEGEGEEGSGISGEREGLGENVSEEFLSAVSEMKETVVVAVPAVEVESSEVVSTHTCVLVTPKWKLAGHLTIRQNVLHFSGEFFVEGTGGSSVFNSFQDRKSSTDSKQDGKDKNAPDDNNSDSLSDSNQSNKIKRHRRWNLVNIKEVHWTRYLLQYTAIEIFFNDSTAPIFLNFASQKEAKQTGSLIVSLRNECLFPKGTSRDKSGMISFVDRQVAAELAETARESWRRREMSNFEYLMILNTLSGRSYNDLTQYPIFPWVLADYSSEKLDINTASSFRDLSKPVGALDPKRFKVFEERYHNFNDPDIPSFYYGSHYSSMGIVLYYLLRLEPFTALHRNLQGGKFDHADRLFQSIESTYKNCLSNTSDVKELIPEFFYMPEFLLNSNLYHLGIKQDGEPLGDVTLPPWAKGSPEEFIRLNREALESEYVSSNLHHWIDLIFGYKQRGKPAVEAANIFYYLTYEGAVDLENMEDLLQKSAIEDQIANFGQTPIQIFKKKHTRRGPPIPIAHPLYFAPASITLTSCIGHGSGSSSAVLLVGLLDSNIVLVNQDLTLSVKMWLTTQLQHGGNLTFSGSLEPFFGVGSDVLAPRKIGTPLAENVDFGRQCLALMQIYNDNYLVSCGNWENSFQVISLNDGRIVQSIRQHKDVVSCVAVSSDGSVLATGSHDTTVMIWQTQKLRHLDKKPTRYTNGHTDNPIVSSPSHILCGHDDIITCLFVSTDLDTVISGSKDGTCIFHTLNTGTYVRSIRHPSGSSLTKLLVSQHGKIVFYSENDLSLNLYSINGKNVASCECNGRVNCMELSCCGEFLVCAGDHGQIVLRSMHNLDVIFKYEGGGKVISSLCVTPEECFLAGTKDGGLLVYSIENPFIKKSGKNSRVKSIAIG